MSDQLPPPRRHRRNDATLPPTMKPGRENAEVFALQHGLFAAQVTMRHEDPAAFQEMRSVILTDYRPANHIELMMAEEVARCQWRMLRAHSMETALLDNRVLATAKEMKVDWEGRHRNINCDEGIAAALEKVDTKRFGLFLDYIRRAERSYYQAVRQSSARRPNAANANSTTQKWRNSIPANGHWVRSAQQKISPICP